MPRSNSLVFLLGFMGSGKSFVGKKVAERLGWAFVDLDFFIEKQTGFSIAHLFSTIGEQGFRKIERDLLRSLFSLKKTVISTGGGTPCFFENMDEMNAHGLTFYLKTPPEILAARLVFGKNKRPLVADLSDEELLPFVKTRLAERESVYLKSNFIVEQPALDLDLADLIFSKFFNER